MWPFKKKNIDAMIKQAVDGALIRTGLTSTLDHAVGLQEEFSKMNGQILDSFQKNREACAINSQSIIALSQSIAKVIQAVNTIDDRLKTLEAQLSVSGVKFSKGN
jgi:hypothetical protein